MKYNIKQVAPVEEPRGSRSVDELVGLGSQELPWGNGGQGGRGVNGISQDNGEHRFGACLCCVSW